MRPRLSRAGFNIELIGQCSEGDPPEWYWINTSNQNRAGPVELPKVDLGDCPLPNCKCAQLEFPISTQAHPARISWYVVIGEIVRAR